MVFLISPPSSAMSRKLSTFQQQTVSRCTRARTRPVPVMSGTGVCHALGTLQTLLLRAGRALFGIGGAVQVLGLGVLFAGRQVCVFTIKRSARGRGNAE